MSGPCEGIRVLDLSNSYPGALATMVLADAGAEVVKVEPPAGDPTRKHYAWVMWHRGKKSVTLDLKTAEGRGHARKLASTADVLIETFRPGVVDRLGLGYVDVSKSHPSLVYCSISGFGATGPLAQVKGYEHVVQAAAGRFDSYTGMVEKKGPLYPSVWLGGYGTAMLAVQGVLAALLVREQTGRGQKVETTMLQGTVAYDLDRWLAWQLCQRTGDPPPRGYPGGPIPPYMTARTKDGYWLQFANMTVDTLHNFLRVLELEHLLKDPRFKTAPVYPTPADEAAMQRMVLAKILERAKDEWMRIFMESDVAGEPLRTTQEGLSHEQALHNGDIVELDDPRVGRTKQLGPLAHFTATPMRPQGPAPDVGQHTREVLARLADTIKRPVPLGGAAPPHPLAGVTIIEFASFIATPMASAILADYGARVIKVEPVTGDLYRTAGKFPKMCRTLQGKESVAIDLKDPRLKEYVRRLIAKADVVLHNFRPGVPERLGIDYEATKALNPRIIYVYSGAYGSTGPHSHRIGFHPIAGAVTGTARFQLGRAYPPPADLQMSLDEVQRASNVLRKANEGNPDPASALATASAILLALYARQRTGQGQYVETSMLSGNFYANADDALWYRGKPERMLTDADFNGVDALYRQYEAKSGWVFLACPRQEEWLALTRALGLEALAGDPRFATPAQRDRLHDAELASALQAAFRAQPASEWQRLLTDRDIACVEVCELGVGQFMNTTPWLKDVGFWRETEHHSLGRYWRHGPPVRFSETPATTGCNTYLGEHTRPVLREAGCPDALIDELVRDGAAVDGAPQVKAKV